MTNISQQQVLACLSTMFDLGSDALELAPSAVLIDDWYREWQSDLAHSQNGYPLAEARRKPELEDKLLEIADVSGLTRTFSRKKRAPTLCLTHDVDYLRPTFQMRAKAFVGRRKVLGVRGTHDYLASMKELLDLDAEAAGRDGAATVFVAACERANGVRDRAKQWLIDPSYTTDSDEFARLRDLLIDRKCEIGLHGSFLSLSSEHLRSERARLEKAVGTPVRCGRQHWLNLPDEDAFDQIRGAGVMFDSTLGWNGTSGFRCGMARPFPLITTRGDLIWEVPLVLMDGPLFDDLKLSTSGVYDHAVEILEEVYARSGCVAINWHERAAHVDYGWSDAYARILKWARQRGFQFQTIPEACDA